MSQPSGYGLQTVEWRLKRADEHLATLDRERSSFLNKDNRRIVGHFERETGEYIFRFEGQLPDRSIGLIVGEFAHHLRAALDNLVWQLVGLRGGVPTWRNEFPIQERRQGYRGKLRRGALRGVSADDRAAIEAIQPFNYRERAPQSYLALLAWLNNVDKHRFIHVGCVVPVRTPIRVSYGAQGEDAGLFPWHPIPVKDVAEILGVDYTASITGEDRAELARVRFRAAGPDPQMKVQADAAVEIAFSDPKQALIITDLKHIRAYVGSIIEGLRPRFGL